MSLRLVSLLFALACTGPAASEPPAEAPAPEAPAAVERATPAPVAAVDLEARGAEVFATHCASCHGPEGRGDGVAAKGLDPAPADLRARPRPAHLRGIPRRQIIEEGRPGTAMVGWKNVLSEEDLDAVYDHVHAMHMPGGG